MKKLYVLLNFYSGWSQFYPFCGGLTCFIAVATSFSSKIHVYLLHIWNLSRLEEHKSTCSSICGYCICALITVSHSIQRPCSLPFIFTQYYWSLVVFLRLQKNPYLLLLLLPSQGFYNRFDKCLPLVVRGCHLHLPARPMSIFMHDRRIPIMKTLSLVKRKTVLPRWKYLLLESMVWLEVMLLEHC